MQNETYKDEIDSKLDILEEELKNQTFSKDKIYIFGGFVKCFYGLRPCSDIDFIIDVPQGTKINKFQNEILQDFGLSENFCEEYYNPTNPKTYKLQQKVNNEKKDDTVVLEDLPLILRQKCIFSCSGLKMGVYWSIYRQLLARYFYTVNHELKTYYTLKDFLLDKNNFIEYRGFMIAKIEYEFLRDEMKRIDLCRMSKKQKDDISNYKKLYKPSKNDCDALLFTKKTFEYNIFYIGNNLENGGKQMLLRRASNKIKRIIGELCEDFHSFNHENPIIIDTNNFSNVFDNVLITSIFNVNMAELEYVNYLFYCNGGISFFLPNHGFLYHDKIIMQGKMRFHYDGAKYKLHFSIGDLPSTLNNKEYKLRLLDLMKIVFHIHKTYDQLLISNKVLIEYKGE